jgi:hypothetical protein
LPSNDQNRVAAPVSISHATLEELRAAAAALRSLSPASRLAALADAKIEKILSGQGKHHGPPSPS